MELGIRKQGTLIVNGGEYDLSITDHVFMAGGNAVIKSGDDRLIISGGVVQHRIYSPDDGWTTFPHVTRLLITPLTPFLGKIQIMCG